MDGGVHAIFVTNFSDCRLVFCSNASEMLLNGTVYSLDVLSRTTQKGTKKLIIEMKENS